MRAQHGCMREARTCSRDDRTIALCDLPPQAPRKIEVRIRYRPARRPHDANLSFHNGTSNITNSGPFKGALCAVTHIVLVNDYPALVARWKALRASGDVAVREVAATGAPRTLLCAELGHTSSPGVALSAGVHGDEPAGPWALLDLCEQRELREQFAYRIWPCTNPTGFARGTRENAEGNDVNRSFGRGGQTPESRAIVTANRDRKYALSIDLHEDCDADGFYCYAYDAADLAASAVDAVRAAGFPVQDVRACDLGVPYAIDRFGAGIVYPDTQDEAASIGGLSYTLSIVRHAAARALTFETPVRLAWADRITIHGIAVKAALTALSNLLPHG